MTEASIWRFGPIQTRALTALASEQIQQIEVPAKREGKALKLISDYPIPFFLLLTAAVLAGWLWFDAAIPVDRAALEASGQHGDSFGMLNTLFSGLAFAAIVAALFLQRLDVNNTLDSVRQQLRLSQQAQASNTESIARFFDTGEMRRARTAAHKIRKEFISNAAFDRKGWAMNWVDSTQAPKTFEDSESIQRMRATSRLIEYYTSLYHHLQNLDPVDQTRLAKNLTQRYYWQFWRGYLLGLGEVVKDVYAAEITNAEQYPLPSWLKELQELDGKCGLAKYDPVDHPIDQWSPIDLQTIFKVVAQPASAPVA